MEKQRKKEEAERKQKQVVKEHEIKILNLLTEFTCGFKVDRVGNNYERKYGEDWKPEIWFKDPKMKHYPENVFTSMHLHDEVTILRSGYIKHVMHQKHYAKLQIHGFTHAEIIPMLELCSSVDDAIKKLKAEKGMNMIDIFDSFQYFLLKQWLLNIYFFFFFFFRSCCKRSTSTNDSSRKRS